MERVVVENVYIDDDPNGIVVSSMRMSPMIGNQKRNVGLLKDGSKILR